MTARPKVVVYDYGSGNLRSVERALDRAGAAVEVTDDQVAAVRCDGLVVPGVGAFSACMAGLEAVGGRAVIGDRVDRGRPVLGLCVGMQVLFDSSEEPGTGVGRGLGVLPGVVRRIRGARVLPHTGWNTVQPAGESPLLAGLAPDTRFYFVHSYAACVGVPPQVEIAEVTGWTEHGSRFAAVIEAGVVSAAQFHPEKSGAAGAAFLGNWLHTLS